MSLISKINKTDPSYFDFRRRMVNKIKKECPFPVIFVGNDALAFFDANESPNRKTNVVELKHKSINKICGQPYNFFVYQKQESCFTISDYQGPLKTVSFTSPCTVFCAFVKDENGKIKHSGVYHAESMPPNAFFYSRLYKLIDTVRLEPDEKVTVKASGSNKDGKDLQKLKEDITKILAVKDVKIELENLLLGGNSYRITEFYPQNGQLITYFSNSKQKIIL